MGGVVGEWVESLVNGWSGWGMDGVVGEWL